MTLHDHGVTHGFVVYVSYGFLTVSYGDSYGFLGVSYGASYGPLAVPYGASYYPSAVAHSLENWSMMTGRVHKFDLAKS